MPIYDPAIRYSSGLRPYIREWMNDNRDKWLGIPISVFEPLDLLAELAEVALFYAFLGSSLIFAFYDQKLPPW